MRDLCGKYKNIFYACLIDILMDYLALNVYKFSCLYFIKYLGIKKQVISNKPPLINFIVFKKNKMLVHVFSLYPTLFISVSWKEKILIRK